MLSGGAVFGQVQQIRMVRPPQVAPPHARAVCQPALGVLLGEIRRTGSLSESSLAWVRRNAEHLATADVQRLMDAIPVAQAQLARGVSTGGALVRTAGAVARGG